MRSNKPLTLLDRYIGSQLFTTIAFAIILFTVIWLAPDTLVKLTQYLFAGKINVWQACEMFVFHLPEVLQQTIPVAVLLGSVVLFQRLTQSYELVACLATGISPARILAAVLYIGLLFGGFHALVNEVVIPYTAPRLEHMYTSLNLTDIPDRNFLFVEKNRQGQLSKFFMIGQTNRSVLSNFIILYYDVTPDQGVRISRIIRARRGHWMDQQNQWELSDGIEYVLSDEGVYKDTRKFAVQQVGTDHYAHILLDYTKLNPMYMPWGQLKTYLRLLKDGGQLQDVPFFEVRLWQKLSGPVATIIFAILGALLGMERVRTNRTYGLTFGAVVIFLYSILVPFSGNFGALDIIAPWFVAWIPLLIAMLATTLIIALRPRQG